MPTWVRAIASASPEYQDESPNFEPGTSDSNNPYDAAVHVDEAALAVVGARDSALQQDE